MQGIARHLAPLLPIFVSAARLRAAAQLEAADAPEDAEDERRRASAFYREVEAVSYVGAVE